MLVNTVAQPIQIDFVEGKHEEHEDARDGGPGLERYRKDERVLLARDQFRLPLGIMGHHLLSTTSQNDICEDKTLRQRHRSQ